jgi:DNA phosphorothioation-dependent restriction protein DptG
MNFFPAIRRMVMSNRRYLHKQFPEKKRKQTIEDKVLYKYRDGLFHNLPVSKWGHVAFSFSDIFEGIESLEKKGLAEVVRKQVSFVHTYYTMDDDWNRKEEKRVVTQNIPIKFRILLDKVS